MFMALLTASCMLQYPKVQTKELKSYDVNTQIFSTSRRSNRNQIVFTIFQWISVWFNKTSKIFLCVDVVTLELFCGYFWVLFFNSFVGTSLRFNSFVALLGTTTLLQHGSLLTLIDHRSRALFVYPPFSVITPGYGQLLHARAMDIPNIVNKFCLTLRSILSVKSSIL